jgi:hypothetical protein
MPAPDFAVEIDILVDANMTAAAGYSANDRTVVKAFLEASIVPEVDPENLLEDYTIPIYDALQAEATYNFGKAIDPFKTMINFLCSETIKIVLQAYSGSGITAKVAMGFMSQGGAANPIVVSEVNFLGTPLTYVRALAGNYEINASVGSPFLDAEKVEVMYSNEVVGFKTRWFIAAPNQIMLEVNEETASLVDGSISGTPADDGLSDLNFKITIYAS